MNINPRILLSGASIVAAVALGVGGTFAAFSDTGTSNSNVFAAGTLDLKLGNNVPAVSDNVTASFGQLAMKPGDCTGDQTLNVKNNGSINASSVKVAGTNTDNNIAQWLRTNNLKFDGTNITVVDSNSNGFQDLQDVAAAGTITLPGGGLTAGTTKALVADVCLDAGTPNTVQGLSDTLDLTFTLEQ